MLWQARRQWGILATSVFLGVLGFVAQAASPLILGRALDSGLENGVTSELRTLALLLLLVGLTNVAAGAFNERYYVANWLRSAYNVTQLIGYKVSRSGPAVRQELPTGEVVSTVAADAHRIGEVYAVISQFLGSLAAYIAVSIIMLQSSPRIALIVIIGVPIMAGLMSFIIKPLQAAQARQREESGRLATLGSDTVSGLRILRGIGGEGVFTRRYNEQSQRVRKTGVEVANVASTLTGMQFLLSGLFATLVLWAGARAALSGEITTGQLVAFYGYAAFLSWPLNLITQAIHVWTRANVALKRIIRVLQVEAATTDVDSTATLPAGPARLHDEVSGLEVTPGQYVALVSQDPDASAVVATRLGRFDDTAEADTPVRLGGTLLREFARDELRDYIVVAESTPYVFAGTLREALDSRGTSSDEKIMEAIAAADAFDVLQSTPNGLDGELPEKGRSLSGGQRQRLALARALLTEPQILVLIEPTSAVDAHTEARIASSLQKARAGRTTLVVSASPLILDHMDEVNVLRDGKVIARGTHRELMHGADLGSQHYHSIVTRTMDGNGATDSPSDDAAASAAEPTNSTQEVTP